MDQKIHTRRNTLSKSERLSAESRIDAVFAGGRRGSSGPLRFSWVLRADDAGSSTVKKNAIEDETAGNTVGHTTGEAWRDTNGDTVNAAVSVLFSVPKKVFKRAWKRNLMKRRMRESYRQRKHELVEVARSLGRSIDIALICIPEGAIKGKGSKGGKGAAAAKTAAPKPPVAVATTKKSGARKTPEVPLPDFKTIDDAIEKILAQITARLRR